VNKDEYYIAYKQRCGLRSNIRADLNSF